MYGYRSVPSSFDCTAIVLHYTPYNVWIINNRIKDSDTGITSSGSKDWYILGNEISNMSISGIHVWGTSATPIIGNTIYNAKSAIFNENSGNRLNIINNVISNAAEYHLYSVNTSSALNSNLENNLFYQSDGLVKIKWGDLSGNVSTFESGAGKSGAGISAQNNIESNPQFVNPLNNDFRLQSTSPAIDSGIESGAYQRFYDLYGIDIKKDFDGKARPQETTWDIGAYEYNPGGIPPSCIKTWSCGAWSACAGGSQTRTCADLNNCGTTTARSPLTQTCSLADLTSPVITGVTAGNLTQTSATLTWTTNEPATTQADYGFTTGYGQTSPFVATLTTAHSVTLANLVAGTLYHYRVRSKDSATNEALSIDFTFTTVAAATPDTIPPQPITDLKTTSVESKSATLAFTAPYQDATNPSSGPVLSYDLRSATTPLTAATWSTATPATGLPTPTTPGQPETYTLVGLTPNQTYSVALKSQDSTGNLSLLSNVVSSVNNEMPSTTIFDTIADGSPKRSRLLMNTTLTIYHHLKTIVAQIFSSLKLKDRDHPQGRKPILTNTEAVTCVILKQQQNIATKKSLYEIVEAPLSYNRFVATLNRTGKYLARIITAIMRLLGKSSHPLKFTDSTDIPVCLNKNGKTHRTMKGLAAWSKTGKGWFYGLKLHLTGDVAGQVLALKLTPGASDDRAIFRQMNEKLRGLFVADAGYVSEKLQSVFFLDGERMLLTAVRANMKKLATRLEIALVRLRMRIEIHFRVLKGCYGLVTSWPRSIDGYLTHYLASITARLLH